MMRPHVTDYSVFGADVTRGSDSFLRSYRMFWWVILTRPDTLCMRINNPNRLWSVVGLELNKSCRI